jgi:hypothetical protein
MDRVTSRKYWLAALFSIVGCIALLKGILDPSHFIELVTVVLVTYGATNIVDKKLNPTQQP